MIVFGNGFKRRVAEAVKDAMEMERQASEKRLGKWKGLHEEVAKLTEQVEALKIEKERIEEGHKRREREIEHKLGLHKQQVEHEKKYAAEMAKVEVDRANLDQDKARFGEQMEFMQERFEKEVKHQRSLMEQMIQRLPSAEIFADLSNGGNGGARRSKSRVG